MPRQVPGEIYVEIIPVGPGLRIAAVCSVTGVEVVFQAPKGTSREQIDRVAIRKLERAVARKHPEQGMVMGGARDGETSSTVEGPHHLGRFARRI